MKILIMSTFNCNNNGLSMCDCQCATGLHRGTPLTFELLDSNSLICFVLGLFVSIISGTEIKFSCDFDGIRFIEILLKNRCCN